MIIEIWKIYFLFFLLEIALRRLREKVYCGLLAPRPFAETRFSLGPYSFKGSSGWIVSKYTFLGCAIATDIIICCILFPFS